MTTDTIAAPAAIRSHDLEVGDGLTMRVNESGERKPGQPSLLMLHGSGPGVSGLSNWTAMLESLGTKYHCIAPDIIGFGDSSHPDPSPQGYEANRDLRIDKIFTMLDELGVDQVIPLGNSLGGLYTLRMAQLQPERLHSMVLMGSGGAPNLPLLPALGKLIRYYDNHSPEGMGDLLLEFVYDKEAFGPRIAELSHERYTIADREDIRRSHAATFAQVGEPPRYSVEELAAIDVRALVIHGRDDAVVPPEASKYIAEHLPNADLYILAKCGHWSQVEQADRFKTLVDNFAAGLI
ncbi:alpha/beta fold hydrolase [Nocardioides sp. cx-173]|uniref:alpha/beta fold hydrolase n=1 Tax=Nocardioides sp. cx-173 TaxID=2898796 RepID=UPI001E36FEDF|nr:alpha/beta hydrolase [Nocardioides sp. cx-173]MCD4526602.1 alpha/beta hydrolase [Nocardioides sp. cx-173]UGB40697.1 alpha/beta hydrolase [Nocardioides sp. cx-173]